MDPQQTRYKVEELLNAYAQCIDDDRLEEWPDFFTERCLYKIIPWENASRDLPVALIYCDSRGMLRDRVVAHRKANLFAPHLYRHLVGNTQVTGQDAGAVLARSNYAVFRTLVDPIDFGRTEIYSVGVFRDRIVFEEGTARFQEKIVLADTCRVQSLMVTPI